MLTMASPHNGHGDALPMSGRKWAGRPIACRVLGWAEQQLGKAHEALRIIREQTPEDLYPLDLLFGGSPVALINEGLLAVAARRLARGAGFLPRPARSSISPRSRCSEHRPHRHPCQKETRT